MSNEINSLMRWQQHENFPDMIISPHRIGNEFEIIAENVRVDCRSAIAATPLMLEEMQRYLVILERAENNPLLWAELTAGTGIATANGYRNAIAKATGI